MSYTLLKVGRVWHYRYQIKRRRIQRSTRESNKRLADAIAHKAYSVAQQEQRGESTMPTLLELIDAWLSVHADIASAPHTKSVRVFKRHHLHGLGGLLITEIDTERVEAARSQHLASHNRATTNQWLATLKLLTNWAVKRKLITHKPFLVPLLKVKKQPKPTLSTNVVSRWLAAVDYHARHNTGVSVAVRLMLGLGLRESEALNARWEWVDWDRGTYTPGQTKGGEAEPIPIPPWLVEYIYPHRCAGGCIVRNRHNRQARPGFTRLVIQRANRDCDLRGITPHRLRGTFATLLSEHGVPVQTIQAVLRHKDPSTTIRYLEKNMDVAIRAQKSIAAQSGLSTAFIPPAKHRR